MFTTILFLLVVVAGAEFAQYALQRLPQPPDLRDERPYLRRFWCWPWTAWCEAPRLDRRQFSQRHGSVILTILCPVQPAGRCLA